jgi:hypothetical protein
VPVHTGSYYTVSSTVGVDTSTTDPRYMLDLIKVGEGREGEEWMEKEKEKMNVRDEVTSNSSH